MQKSELVNELFKSLALAQGEIENAAKNSNNPHFKSKYADLAEVLNTVRPVFSKNGLSIIQCPSFDGELVTVETTIAHDSGQWISEVAKSPCVKRDAQGIGSVITYLRRYSLAAFAGIAQEDDDTQSGVGSNPPKQQPKLKEQPKAKESIPDDRLSNALAQISAGKYTQEKLLANFELTESQLKNVEDFMKSLTEQEIPS